MTKWGVGSEVRGRRVGGGGEERVPKSEKEETDQNIEKYKQT